MAQADTSLDNSNIPLLLAGPILRRTEVRRLVIWLAVSRPADVRLDLYLPDGSHLQERHACDETDSHVKLLKAGDSLHYLLVDIQLERALPLDEKIEYDLSLLEASAGTGPANWQSLAGLCPHLLYPGEDRLSFRVPGQVKSILHGSCRKPHHPSGDGLVEADRLLARLIRGEGEDNEDLPEWPAALLMAGDQIYADDVAGPMLKAIHDVIMALGLYPEAFHMLDRDCIESCRELYPDRDNYYHRLQLLPVMKAESGLADIFIGGIRKPIFTTDTADNHLITLAEHMVMYLMVWSPAPWKLASHEPPRCLSPKERRRYREELRVIDDFEAGLAKVQRLFAHLPTAMIFDDHDISDDWNLNRVWEEAVYGHPFSKRMVGNGLISYFLSQGWGNDPDKFSDEFLADLQAAMEAPDSDPHDAFVEEILKFEGWEYVWDCEPPLVVLDTRTRRWRSESSTVKPAGLLDWEAITDLLQVLRGKDAVIMVSPTPIFGVKLIEAIQRFFTWIGKPLLVDAENWMAHPGTAHAILNLFMHKRTPKNFVILSGDVHYSFMYDVELRRHNDGPDIFQICSSGFRNEFPRKLLRSLDILNRWLYAPGSPLNWFTKRRRMRVVPRRPEGLPDGRRLLNGAGAGLVELDGDGRPWRVRQLMADGPARGFDRMESHSQYR